MLKSVCSDSLPNAGSYPPDSLLLFSFKYCICEAEAELTLYAQNLVSYYLQIYLHLVDVLGLFLSPERGEGLCTLLDHFGSG